MSKSLGERPKEPMMRPLMPIPVSPEQSDRMADEDAVTVRRPPGERIVSAPPPPPPSPPPMAQEEVLFAGSNKDQTMVWSRHFVKDRELSLNPDHRYSVIIAPAATVQAREVIEVMRKYLGLNDSGVVYAIKRRHGILASDLTLNESVELAKEFNENGQSVCVIEQDDRLAFGEPSDVMRIKFEEKTAKFYTLDKAVSRKYKDMVGIGCGSAAAQAGSPERDVLDLFFAEPGLHLRIWRNTLMSAPTAFTGKVENVGEFHLLAKHLIKLAPDAIQTQSFIQWVGGTDPKIPVQFSSLIEYDNYTRWYLMAHYGRSKPFEPVLRKR
ncbi:hypothetical protein HYR69_06435 [Candidatus Sumerlaeota bacterium]|nr:hypothetical protein [Candidatus Sumerlaeota bacterium]